MPETQKKVVNPEKELRGKRPYNRAPQKKAYQAKPKRLDAGEVPEGAAALKKKLRDTLRLLSKNTKMPADIRLEHERRIEALKLQIAEKQVDQTEQKMSTKYRMLKFFESKKAERKIKVFVKQHPDWEKNADEKKELESLKLDLAYIQHYPKTQKYIALYPNENADDPVVSKARNDIREKVRVELQSGEIGQFVKEAREEIKSKILNKDSLTTEEAIKLTAQKINNSKKRTILDDQDPLASRARATAEREASKPIKVSAVEEETFFETIPKVIAASDIAATKRSTKKAKREKQDEKKVQAVVQEQPKQEQPKKVHHKSDQSKDEHPKTRQSKEDDNSSDSDDASEDEPAAPVRKIVKIDMSLLKELPEVPKRRGGRNLNKYKK
ncbi:18S rRNA maturation protein [Modicella reniformis]|uniref:rRNA-processing protein EFG1 n=1 Tax=Modicella reniformis TaxID=1440133 RepID=A0A9P6IKZ5_9FUNG|nr:18S rRNA maturation protein [Modicella reniformis]